MKASLLLALAAVALADGPSPSARNARVQSLLQLEEFQAALEEAKSLNRERPDDIAGYQGLAAAHLALGEYEEAERALQWMLDLRIGKADSAGWLLLARFREAIGDLDGALESLNSAFGRLTPGQDSEERALFVYSAHLLLAAGKYGFAEQALARAVAPDDPSALEVLGRLRLAQGRRAEAVRLWRRAETVQSHPRRLYLIAQATGNKQDYQAFEREARDRMDRPGNANRELILFLAGPGKRPAEALSLARRETAAKRDVLTMDALAVALFASGKRGEARSTLKSVLAVGTRDPLILEHASKFGVTTE